MADGTAATYLTDNKRSWDMCAPASAASPTYATEKYIADPRHLSNVVRFDRERLPDISGLAGLHLQCHIGTDTVSLARLGATMTGLDFSSAAVEEARSLARRCGTPAEFVRSDVYAAPKVLAPRSFDFVYTGVGALCWLPDIARWAAVVSTLLRPGGFLFVREGHPMLWAIDVRHADRVVVDRPYFERPESVVMSGPGAYVETSATFPSMRTHEWNRGLGEIVTALFDQGMELTALTEHDSVPWEAIPGQMSCDDQGEWRLADRPWRLAASYTLQARRLAARPGALALA